DTTYTQCGGNYVPSNYLDSVDTVNAVAGQVNYFIGGDYFNDRFLLLTIDDIYRPIIRRSDFAALISSFFDDILTNDRLKAHIQKLKIDGPKGTDNLLNWDCDKEMAEAIAEGKTEGEANAAKAFCENWKKRIFNWAEIFFITQLRDDEPRPPNCTRVIIFAGQKKPGQNRITSDDKQNKANYLEGANLAAFDTPTAASNNFDIALLPIFTPDEPWKDIVYCIPAAP
ncbi:MAG: hypothetical protein FWD50_06665, partial [Betaproteobacteria bacterium]|nr:hypothetical protein [Betaproteobacteria bacterium]